jgi:hypothetical protein
MTSSGHEMFWLVFCPISTFVRKALCARGIGCARAKGRKLLTAIVPRFETLETTVFMVVGSAIFVYGAHEPLACIEKGRLP